MAEVHGTDNSVGETLAMIASDMELATIIMAMGRKSAARKAKLHFQACQKAISELCPIDSEIDSMSNEELLANLFE
jgi:hypothetical protein